ncbi:HAD family hydrolase [Halomonas sp. KAO]|uniref:HAD family hydrolase n=1 Tax=Halomonas sp. KAO TaxID=2783858 RepID=UPI0018A0EDED|nr:HAD family hydrolase [Halomonas sp. KAO]MBF7052337.1 HAD family hydrolase [Halomonas sp. KAO]
MKETYTALKEFGATFLGPALTMYARAVEQEAHDKLPVCLAREGWLLHQLLTHLYDEGLIHLDRAPIYLKVSRTLLFRAMLGEAATWDIALKMEFEGTLLELLMKRFGLQMHEAFASMPAEVLGFKLSLPEQADEVREWLTPHAERLKQQAAPTHQAAYRYFQDQGLTQEEVMPLLLDVGYAGSIQKLCTRFVQRDTAGLYFIATKPGKQSLGDQVATMKGVFREGVAWKEDYTLLERSLLLECMMTAPHGQVVDIRQSQDGDYLFFYGREASSQRYYQNLEAVLEGAREAVTEALRNKVTYSVEEVESLYEVFATRPGAIPQAAWHLFTADDDITGNGMVNPLQIFGI